MTKQIPKEIIEGGCVPIIVGVTGHRYITSRVEPLIEQVFTELHDKYPNTPIVVLSPLADGADRLVAKVALDLKKVDLDLKKDKELPISLICPLPMPRSEYENDFRGRDGSNKEFDSFLDDWLSKEDWFALPMVGDNTIKNIAADETIIRDGKEVKRRDLQYEQVGKYIAQHSHILLALWDGIDGPEETGGTSQILKMRHEGTLKNYRNPLDEIDSGPIYHFPIENNTKGEANIGKRREIFPGAHLYPLSFSRAHGKTGYFGVGTYMDEWGI